MTREAFELSERKASPVLLRIVTRLAHGRSSVSFAPRLAQNPVDKAGDRWGWNLMPSVARELWKDLLGKYEGLRSEIEARTRIEPGSDRLGVVTTGLALQYYLENADELDPKPTHLHIGSYPLPHAALRELATRVGRILVLEEGYPFVERSLRGILPSPIPIAGKESGEVPLTGELSPDSVRAALGLAVRPGMAAALHPGREGEGLVPPKRPPQLCAGCPHGDSFSFLTEALAGHRVFAVNGDIGCYTLGALAPYSAIETVVEMGASFGMARGASEAGLKPAVGVIGDSTFYHSGIPNLVDAVSHGTNVKFLILDNATTGMTGAQPTIMPSERLKAIALAVGVDPAHVHIVRAHRGDHEANTALMKRELEYVGVSVVIAFRECIEALKKARTA
jgi:indolepyruvate ferredoxin oxidoreductase alpha subunit